MRKVCSNNMGWKIILFFLPILLMLQCSAPKEISNENLKKLDPVLTDLLQGKEDSSRLEITTDSLGVKLFGVLVYCSNPEDLKKLSIKVSSQIGEIFVARITQEQLKAIVKLPSVRRVEAGRIVSPQLKVNEGI